MALPPRYSATARSSQDSGLIVFLCASIRASVVVVCGRLGPCSMVRVGGSVGLFRCSFSEIKMKQLSLMPGLNHLHLLLPHAPLKGRWGRGERRTSLAAATTGMEMAFSSPRERASLISFC